MYNFDLRRHWRGVLNHLSDFWHLWLIVLILTTCSFFRFYLGCQISIVAFLVLFLVKPMTVVYSLAGTFGSIRAFFVALILIMSSFFCIYYFIFFKDAGVSYDNEPTQMICDMFHDQEKNTISIAIPDTNIRIEKRSVSGTVLYDTIESISYKNIHYQKVTWIQVAENTVMTTLTQCPTDFFYLSSIYGNDLDIHVLEKDRPKAMLFSALLILQVLLSWIFLGIFISLLYSKFRYEA